MSTHVNLFCIPVGATVQEPSDFRYLYENADGFTVLPTYYALYGPMGCMSSSILQDALPNAQIDPTRVG